MDSLSNVIAMLAQMTSTGLKVTEQAVQTPILIVNLQESRGEGGEAGEVEDDQETIGSNIFVVF